MRTHLVSLNRPLPGPSITFKIPRMSNDDPVEEKKFKHHISTYSPVQLEYLQDRAIDAMSCYMTLVAVVFESNTFVDHVYVL